MIFFGRFYAGCDKSEKITLIMDSVKRESKACPQTSLTNEEILWFEWPKTPKMCLLKRG